MSEAVSASPPATGRLRIAAREDVVIARAVERLTAA
jgi:hypothetical protein